MIREDTNSDPYILVQKEEIDNPESGKIIYPDEKDCVISPLNRGFLYGDGVFETMRSYDDNIEFLGKHVCRINKALREISIPFSFKRSGIEKRINRVIKNINGDSYIRFSITRGKRENLLSPTEDSFVLILIAKKLKKRKYSPASVEIVDETRPIGIISENKTHNYLPNIIAKSQTSLDEAIMLDKDGNIASGATSNIFLFDENTLKTPSNYIRKGVTREIVLDIAKDIGIETMIQNISDIDRIKSGFLTNSVWGIRSIKKIDGKDLNQNDRKIEEISKRYYKLVKS